MGAPRKIDTVEAIKMRVMGSTLKEIGDHFGTSAEAVRQALERADQKKKEQKKLARLLVSATGVAQQSRPGNPSDISKTIEDWTAILEMAKRATELDSEVAILKERLTRLEDLLPKEGQSQENG